MALSKLYFYSRHSPPANNVTNSTL